MRGSGLQESAQALGFAHSVTGVSVQASPYRQKLPRPVLAAHAGGPSCSRDSCSQLLCRPV